MSSGSAVTPLAVTERWVWRLGVAGLSGGLLVAVAVVLAIAVIAPPSTALAVPVFLGLMLAAGLAARRYWHPALPTLALVAAYGPLSGHDDGTQIGEVAFAVAYAVFLATWFGARVFVYRERIVRTSADAALILLLGYVVLSPILTVVFGGSPSNALTDVLNISMLALYFPLREVGGRYRHGMTMLAGLVLWFGIVSVFRVVVSLNDAFASAEHAWQVARGRVTVGELFLYQAALMCLALAAVYRRWGLRLAYVAGFGVFTVGLLLTQWRSYYVALALGIGVLGVVLRGAERGRMVGLVVVGSFLAALFAYAAFGDTVALIGYGLLDRTLSLATASQVDVSLINRGFESRALLGRVWESPVLGHGPGVEFSFLDILFHATWAKTYAHNAYLSMLFKYGFFGTALFMYFWVSLAVRSLLLSRDARNPDRVYVCFAAAALLPIFASHLVSAAFNTGDTVLAYTFIFAFAGALIERARVAPAAPSPAGEPGG